MEYAIVGIICVIVGLGIGFLIGFIYRKSIGEKAIGSAEKEAERIVEQAKKDGESKKKELLLEAKEETLKIKNEHERENKEARAEIAKIEKRVIQKEESLDKKLDTLQKKEEILAEKLKANEAEVEKINELKAQQLEELQRISGMTTEEAKDLIVSKVEDEAKISAAKRLVAIEADLKETAEEKAKEIIVTAMQRIASDSVAEKTVSVVDLPNDEMKGRIIGREGRNIRTIENLAGVDLIIDDTSDAITISTFDPTRREIARLALQNLVADGRIHPSRIEEMIEKSRKEVENTIKKEGEQATYETGVHGVNLEIIKTLGKLKYRTSYGQNVLRHSIEVAHLSGMIAKELGVDAYIAKRAGLLHDIGKATSQEAGGSHVQIGVELAKKYKESKEVVHAIEAHHGDVEAKSVYAVIVQVADAISAARPGARRDNLENYIRRLQRLEEIATDFEGIEKAFAIQAGREIRVLVNPEMISDADMVLKARDIATKIEEELDYPGQVKINMIRETRVFDYAK